MEEQEKIESNINSIIMQCYSKGISEISTKKMINYVKNKYDFDIDENYLNEILSKNKNVNSVVEDKIILGTPEQAEEEDMDSELHDNAVDQATSDLQQMESVADALDKIETGYTFPSNKIKLDENDLYYHLHKGAVKNKKNYIVANVVPKKDLNESTVNCKIEGTSFFVEIPIKNFVKTVDKP